MKFAIILEEEDGSFSVHCPLLKGCHSQGANRDEAIANIREAIELYLETVHEQTRRYSFLDSHCSVIEIAV